MVLAVNFKHMLAEIKTCGTGPGKEALSHIESIVTLTRTSLFYHTSSSKMEPVNHSQMDAGL